MSTFPQSTIGLEYFTITDKKPNTKTMTPQMAFSGWMVCVMVGSLTKGNNQTQFNLFLGKLDQLYFDPARWWWPKVTPFFAYSTKMGRK